MRAAAALVAVMMSVAARPVHHVAPRAPSGLPRLVIYFQTTHDADGLPVSMLPLITEKQIALTHLVVCSFHIYGNGSIHLNDFPPGRPLFSTLWNETRIMQAAGVKVMGMVGGAAAGSFGADTLDGDAAAFERAYGLLRGEIRARSLDGMDIDVEEPMSQAGIARLVRRLRADFGRDFTITLAPTATALWQRGGSISGFDYMALERAAGRDIDFYNAQFYNGFGDMGSAAAFGRVVEAGWDPGRIVAGQLTSPANGGAGYVAPAQLGATVRALRRQ